MREVINSFISILFGVLIEYYCWTDNLEAEYGGITPYLVLCMLGIPFFEPNAYFLFVLLIFHTYTDEQKQIAYTYPTLIAGAIELILLILGGITKEVVIAIIICAVMVHIMSAVGAFAKGDMYMLDVLLIYAGCAGRNIFDVLIVIIGTAFVTFVARILITNIRQLIKRKPFIRTAPMMGSILCGYICYFFL